MDLQLNNKKALITGSTASIGYAIAKQLANANVHVYINGRTNERVEATIKKLKTETGNQNIEGFAVDFSESKQIENLIKQLPEIDILVNNVGIFEPKAFKDISDADWFKFFEVNILSGNGLHVLTLIKCLKKTGDELFSFPANQQYRYLMK